jgi:hypothetical protein
MMLETRSRTNHERRSVVNMSDAFASPCVACFPWVITPLALRSLTL